MSLETAGNIAALFSGAVKGYQDQSEIELKKQQLARDEELKRLQIEAGLMEKGLIKSANGGWEYSPEELDKRKLDRDYKQAQIGATDALAEYRKTGGLLGNQIKAVKEGIEFDPITGIPRPGDKMKALDKITLDYKKAQIDKELGIAPLSEAPSVAAKNYLDAEKTKEILRREYGIEIGPKGERIPIEGWRRPYTKVEEQAIKDYRDQGWEYDPITKTKVKIEGWKTKSEKDIVTDTIKRNTATKIGNWMGFHNTISSSIKQLENPKISEKQKIQIANSLAKTLNSMMSASLDAAAEAETQRAIGLMDPILNKYKWTIGPETSEFIKQAKLANNILKSSIIKSEDAINRMKEGQSISSGLIETPIEEVYEKQKPTVTYDAKKVEAAQKALKDPNASDKIKRGARSYLNQLTGIK